MLWVCKQDGVKYAVGMPACPQCGATDHWDEGDVPSAEPPPVVDDAGEGSPEPVVAAKPVEVVKATGLGK